ncbi:lysozyme family protein [Enterococcus faecalis]|nr:lysozyme family protein [Enterococcus faecalis]MBO6453348.1 lysozyme family protein [Enterococcus faecalis]
MKVNQYMCRRIKGKIILIIVVIGMISTPLIALLGGGADKEYSSSDESMGAINLSPEVLLHRPMVEKYAKLEGIPNEVDVLLAIMMVETGGRGRDVMQSSESMGLPVNTLDLEPSIEQGVKHYKGCMEDSAKLGNDKWTAVASYNFGRNYNNYIGNNGHKHSTELADKYSLTVVAPSLGNSTGQRYSYPNPVAIPYNGGYLYLNGGNFFYVLLVQHYLTLNSNGTGNGTNSATGWKKKAVELAVKDVGQSFTTGWGQRGECIVAVQGWINGAKAGTFRPGGVRTGYLQSGAKEVAWNQAKSGDVIQYENLGNPDLFDVGVHTMLVESVNKDGTINVVESNNPGGSGLVGQRKGVTNRAPSGWRAVVWRFVD